jgi:3-deoxy-D-manno-octulosonic-acid transferase
MLGSFRFVLAQSATDACRLRQLGAAGVETPGNLKDAAPPLPADPKQLADLLEAVGDRPVFLAASTQPGEEALVLDAHRALAPAYPRLLTIIVPRHPERGAAIAAAIDGLVTSRRATGSLPGARDAVHIADTLGELGLFYRLATVCFVGGSLVPHGGQNPLEAARLGCPILIGPHHWNFADPVARLLAAGGARLVEPGTLAAAVADVLTDSDRSRRMAEAAAQVATAGAELSGLVAEMLLTLLPRGTGVPEEPTPARLRDGMVGNAGPASGFE